MHTPPESTLPPDAMARLRVAGAAEDFFTVLGVPYDPAVLAVARLHILKRMADYLSSVDLDHLPQAEAALRCRTELSRAYADFVSSTPLEQRVFKVLQRAVAPKKKAFVPLDRLFSPRS